MVSTRRTAHKEPETDMTDINHTLRKKPVRRATAKKTETEPQPEPKRTRAKKAAPTPDPIPANETPEEAVPEPQTKPARKAGRPRKQAPEPVAEEPPVVEEPSKPTRSTAASRAKTAELAAKRRDETAASAPGPTRRTRATTTKAQPLSPKKITQVSRPKSRNTKPVDEKPAIVRTASKSRSTRTRTISDENADVPELSPIEQEKEEEVIVVVSTPVKRVSPSKRAAASETEVASEGTMSSGPTTPSDSPAPTFERMADEHEYLRNGQVSPHASEEEDEEEELMAESDDELCGPKTPLKRLRLGSDARFHASIQRSIRRAQLTTPMEKPRSLVTRSRKVGTPQTQKPYCKPTVPASEPRPMTVSRGADRAFVFQDLRALPTEEEDEEEEKREEDEEDEEENKVEDDHENSILHDEDRSAQSEANEEVVGPAFDENEECGPLGTSTATDDQDGAAMEKPIEISDDESMHHIGSQGHETDAEEKEASDCDEGDDSVLVNEQQHHSADEECDLDETVVVDDEEQQALSPPAEHYYELLTADDTILITRDEGDSLLGAGNDKAEAETASPQASPGIPETMIWENLRQDVTIPINFDMHMASVRDTSRIKSDERVSTVADFAPFPVEDSDTNETVLEEEQDVSIDEETTDSVLGGAQGRTSAIDKDNLDPTMDFNIFVDMAALAEPTQRIELPPLVLEHQSEDVGKELTESIDVGTAPAATTDNDTLVDDMSVTGQNEQQIEDSSAPQSENQVAIEETDVPHYALPTLAFDARRKSLPAVGMRTPLKSGSRPNTSDGGSIARLLNPFGESWWARSRAEPAMATPVRLSTAHGIVSTKKVGTPSRKTGAFEGPTTPCATPQERFPRLQSLMNYQEHAQTAMPASRFRTPVQSSPQRPATAQKPTVSAVTPRASTLRPRRQVTEVECVTEPASTPLAAPCIAAQTPSERYPRRETRPDYQAHANTVDAPVRFRTPATRQAKLPATTQKAMRAAETPTALSFKATTDVDSEPVQPSTPDQASSSPMIAATPVETPSERFPRLASRQNYEEYPQTAAAPVRFRTPAQSPLKRPSTTQKLFTLRRVAFENSTPKTTRTPVKTPLKPPAMTPSQAPMTPHPAAPLKGVVAMVEVFTLEGASASAPFLALLHRLGAKATKAWSDRVTHVIFKDGSPTTLQRVRLHNKEVEESGKGIHIYCVNSRWVSDCDAEGTRVDENEEFYAVDVAEIPRGGRRRRKSMEPSALVNLGGNIVRDRKNSLGRSSLGRSPMKFGADSPVKGGLMLTPKVDIEDKENSIVDISSPATPAYLAAPDQLIQQTAPINRMRKLGGKAQERAKNRRLTYFPSRA